MSKDRIAQLRDLLEEARDKGDDDKIKEIETEMFQVSGYNPKSRSKNAKGGFPDLTGDNKITRKDILKGRGVELSGGGAALMDATSDKAPNSGVSRGGGAALRGIKFKGVR